MVFSTDDTVVTLPVLPKYISTEDRNNVQVILGLLVLLEIRVEPSRDHHQRSGSTLMIPLVTHMFVKNLLMEKFHPSAHPQASPD